MVMLAYAMGYRAYIHEYQMVMVYAVFFVFTFFIWKKGKQEPTLGKVVIPWSIFIFLLAIFLWFKTGGLNGSGIVFFSVTLILVIIADKKWRIRLAVVFFVIQLVLVLADAHFKHLPIWGFNDKPHIDFILLTSILLSLMVTLKNSYDDKELKIEQFHQSLRELHRLNLRHDSNLDEVLSDYLNSGSQLLGMHIGIIAEVVRGEPMIKNYNETLDYRQSLKEMLALHKSVIMEVDLEKRTLFSAGSNSNLNLDTPSGHVPKYFIASPVMVNNSMYGVLLFSADNANRSQFEEYDIEIVELMAINISHLIQLKLWKKNQAEADKALSLSEKRFKSIYDYASVGICVCDMEGTIVMANRAVEKIYGYKEHEIVNTKFFFFSHAEELDVDMKEDIDLFQKTISGEIDHYVIEKRIQAKDGRIIYIRKTVTAVIDEKDKTQFVIVLNDDITERIANDEKIGKLNKELGVQVEKLEEANKELESFSYSVSHDLRAPLRAIDGFSKIILEDNEDEFSDESKRLLNVIIKNSRKMATLIDDLLEFSRITRRIVEFKPINFDEIVNGIIEEQALDHSIFTIETLPSVKGEPTLMKQVFSNLIGNAVKFSSNKEKPRIEIGVSEKSEFYEFFVKDNGVGFDMAYYDKVFGVFQRLHTDEEFKGTGVGLAIVLKVVMRHQGKVWAESEVGVGTTFYFTLPK